MKHSYFALVRFKIGPRRKCNKCWSISRLNGLNTQCPCHCPCNTYVVVLLAVILGVEQYAKVFYIKYKRFKSFCGKLLLRIILNSVKGVFRCENDCFSISVFPV